MMLILSVRYGRLLTNIIINLHFILRKGTSLMIILYNIHLRNSVLCLDLPIIEKLR